MSLEEFSLLPDKYIVLVRQDAGMYLEIVPMYEAKGGGFEQSRPPLCCTYIPGTRGYTFCRLAPPGARGNTLKQAGVGYFIIVAH
jgi:hypothetical protein